MPRPDGEDWLEGRPASEPIEASPEARRRVRDPRWWLVAVVAALLAGTSWEAVGAAIGDGSFDFGEALDNTVIAFVSVAVTAIFTARI